MKPQVKKIAQIAYSKFYTRVLEVFFHYPEKEFSLSDLAKEILDFWDACFQEIILLLEKELGRE